jgi:histidine phosphotransferase ChpT
MTDSGENVLLSGLVASKICHDLISPVGAIVNGIELLEEVNPEDDNDMLAHTVQMIKSSAQTASARLQILRISLGASKLTNTMAVDEMFRLILELTKCLGNGAIVLETKSNVDVLSNDYAKLLLNLAIMVSDTLIRGGKLFVDLRKDNKTTYIEITATITSEKPIFPPRGIPVLEKGAILEKMESSDVEPYICHKIIARHSGNLTLKMDTFTFSAQVTLRNILQ